MIDPDPESDADPLVQLAEEFAGRYRRGEHPSLTEYAEKYPDQADRIRRLFPALVEMERIGPIGGHASSFRGGAPIGDGGAPKRLGEYRILREVARGGMGIVYEAVQESLGRHVALKIFPSSRLMSPTNLERFRREARASARLHHTNIVPVFGVGEHEGVHYFAMQFIQGQSLDRVLHDLGRLLNASSPPDPGEPRREDSRAGIARGLLTGRFHDLGTQTEEAPSPSDEERSGSGSKFAGHTNTTAYARSVARVGVQVAEALAYSHQQGILHRDIKPANILLDTRGTVWVSDFGLVKEEGTQELTTTGDFVGTLRYMAPERFHGRSEPRGDIYGLGLTLYEMLTLQPAFAGSDRARLVDRVQHEEPVRPRSLDPHIPRDLETIVLKAIAKEPGRRYATAAAMAEDLRRFLADRPVEARRVARWERAWRSARRNPGLAASSASALVLLIVITVGSFASAARLGIELGRTNEAKRAERDAKQDALDKLWRSLLARAQAGRFSRKPGQRIDSLAALREAARIAREVGMPEGAIDSLRNETIACLALTDLTPGSVSVAIPPGTSGIIFDGDFHHYALRDAKGAIRIHRLGDDRASRLLPGLGGEPEALLLSPDGRFVASAASGRFQVWAVGDGRALFPEPLTDHSLMLFSGDSRRMTAARPDGAIVVWDLTTGKEIRCLRPGIASNVVAIHPDGRRLAVSDGEDEGVVEVWDVETGAKVSELSVGGSGLICSLAWHPDGRRLALGFRSPASRVQIWDVVERRALANLEGHAESVSILAFHPSGDLLVTQSHDGTNRLWDAGTGRQLINWPTTSVQDVHFNRAGTVCGFEVTGTLARLVEVADGREYRTLVSTLGSRPGGYREGAIDADGLLAVSMDDGTSLWDLNTGGEVSFLPEGFMNSVNFVSRPEGRELLTCGPEGLHRWPLRNIGEVPGRLQIGPPTIVRLPFVPIRAHVDSGGRAVAVASQKEEKAMVLNLATEAVASTMAPHPLVSGVTISPDGRWVATSGWHSPSVKVWDAHSGAMVKELDLGLMNNATFSPDGRTLVTSRSDDYQFWEVETWRPVRRIPWEVRSYPGWVAFSHDLRIQAMELSPAVIHLIDSATGRTLAKLEDPRSDRAQWLGFTPDDAKLVAISRYSKAIHVWDLSAIRRNLAAMDLDWGSPFIPMAPAAGERRPIAVEPSLGELSPTGPAAFVRTQRSLEKYRVAYEANPESAMACNNLSWAYAVSPEPLRDPRQALALAEKALKLEPRDPLIHNTLGLAYYRTGRYREAADTLQANLPDQSEKLLAMDLLFLAMAHHQLGEPELARSYYNWSRRAASSQGELTLGDSQERTAFLAEAEELMEK